jgi:2-hydroxy-3-oxopropionate reductase
MRIAFIGLGVMGLPMAANLVKAGHEVTGFNRSSAKASRLVELGGRAASSVAEAVVDAEAVITMLPDSPDVRASYIGDEGIIASTARGALLIDMSSIRPDVAIEVSSYASRKGFPMLDAPVSGGQKGAEDGALSIMVGGESDAFEQARAIFDVLGSTIVHVGQSGAGQTVKAANQLLVAGTIELVAEALVFLDAHSVELEPAIKVLNGGLAGSAILSRKASGMLEKNFAPGFRVELHHKDLGIYRDAASAAGVFSPLGAAVTELMGSLLATGGGQLDHTALLVQVDELSGRRIWTR